MFKKIHKPLKLNVKWSEGVAVVRMSGSAGMSEAEKLRDTLEKIVAEKPPIVVLDLKNMDFIGSAGLGAIVEAYLKSRHHEGQFRLVKPSETVQQVLNTTHLSRLFKIFPSVEQAVSGQ